MRSTCASCGREPREPGRGLGARCRRKGEEARAARREQVAAVRAIKRLERGGEA